MLDQVRERGLARVGLAKRRHGDRGEHAGGLSELLQRPLHRQRVHYRRQHADRIGPSALDPLVRALESAKEIAAPDNNRDLHAEIRRGLQVACNTL
jgi:hypothetical protein